MVVVSVREKEMGVDGKAQERRGKGKTKAGQGLGARTGPTLGGTAIWVSYPAVGVLTSLVFLCVCFFF